MVPSLKLVWFGFLLGLLLKLQRSRIVQDRLGFSLYKISKSSLAILGRMNSIDWNLFNYKSLVVTRLWAGLFHILTYHLENFQSKI